MAKRAPNGAGTVRRRKDGRYEGRVSMGFNPATGKQRQKSIYGWSQKEVVAKMQALNVSIEVGDYTEPSKITVAQWFSTWMKEYNGHLAELSRNRYKGMIDGRINAALGATRLQKLTPPVLQGFYNALTADGLKASSVRVYHRVIRVALNQAVKLGYIKTNPASLCVLPKMEQRKMSVMDDVAAGAFLSAIQGHKFEVLYYVSLFTGARIGEVLGLAWDAVNFEDGTIAIDKQLRRSIKEGEPITAQTKTGKGRIVKPAPVVIERLRERQRQQIEDRLKAGPAWDNPANLVFTTATGRWISYETVSYQYDAIVAAIGHPELRVHDMRHTYAVMSLANGDDIKTIQENLGHHSAAFTLDVYGHVTDKMKDASANRMQQFIDTISKQG